MKKLALSSSILILGLLVAPQMLVSQAGMVKEVLVAQNGASPAKPLAEELQGKPVVVDIYATWCSGCKNIAPTLSRLQQQYKGKAHFIKLDVSDRGTTQEAEMKAQKLGLSQFLAAHKSQTSMVAIIDPATGEVVRQFRNNPTLKDYTVVLDRAIAQMKK